MATSGEYGSAERAVEAALKKGGGEVSMKDLIPATDPHAALKHQAVANLEAGEKVTYGKTSNGEFGVIATDQGRDQGLGR
jgi:hypothetical protein